jgi:hypothetical protein
MDLQAMKRRWARRLLKPMLSWARLGDPADGFSIVLGTPWALRHLLEVNLHFVARTDLQRLDRIFVVFDRVRQPGADQFIQDVRGAFPELPLEFSFHPWLPGRVVQAINQSKFYACLNWVTGLTQCRTRFAVLHDFDLYPVIPNFFTEIVGAMEGRGLRFSGSEHTGFDGLTARDALIGTWELGVDVEWLRRTYRPIDCFHSVATVNGRRVDLDGFSEIQSRTPERALAGTVDRESYAHVTNLCSTYLRYQKGEPVHIAWRLHYLWYLESLAAHVGPRRLAAAVGAMREATSAALFFEGRHVDLTGMHVTCSNVLRKDIARMEEALFGGCRPEADEYLNEFEQFLYRHGDASELATAAP